MLLHKAIPIAVGYKDIRAKGESFCLSFDNFFKVIKNDIEVISSEWKVKVKVISFRI